MEEFLKLLIEPLVSDIKKIKIEKVENERNFQFKILVPKNDIAKLIGKEGKMIKAIKNLIKIRAIKEEVFVTLEIQEV
ncbi:hypothetical protein A3I53_00280 [Candidatus Curtissbacteria bacterium RIFCSPLOWO2_02_FULL_40_13b]|uniref:Uncharacterized protein n=3 Tax=Candidatus Curtissiibacteriota TaxID=1752717 RepID=A0A1F5HY96_9BACT|nr:MAG: hypothetical protein A2693_04445 [Candidatus Curtissbacteria bacterium RIFCSPHIGHO2_01_FULL_40_12]OGE04646.1 MAG: hypothetical protein A3F45_04175 [Candidatus Curtissbacteria bacterium RIFCSPHIGHO2_12_FULL_41_17]OGE09073.1 MAG: hypothetical protein A3I53_00280 [Candidatus Curtissbacteria bacterium RIFCSPLOWO2_02_FULL_40_13b]